MMRKMLFVCLGNSCSSPMAQAIMHNLMEKTSLYWEVDSAALRSWNVGRRPHKNCLRVLREHGLRTDHYCRQFGVQDFRYFDMIVAMDEQVFKELSVWAEHNRCSRNCKLEMLGSYGRNGQGISIVELSPTKKLKLFRDAYYQIKKCCKELILSQDVNIVQYEVPSTEDDLELEQQAMEYQEEAVKRPKKKFHKIRRIKVARHNSNNNPPDVPNTNPNTNTYTNTIIPQQKVLVAI